MCINSRLGNPNPDSRYFCLSFGGFPSQVTRNLSTASSPNVKRLHWSCYLLLKAAKLVHPRSFVNLSARKWIGHSRHGLFREPPIISKACQHYRTTISIKRPHTSFLNVIYATCEPSNQSYFLKALISLISVRRAFYQRVQIRPAENCAKF